MKSYEMKSIDLQNLKKNLKLNFLFAASTSHDPWKTILGFKLLAEKSDLRGQLKEEV